MFVPCEKNTEENHNMKVANKSDENVAYLRYLRVAVTCLNCMFGVINSRLNSGNAG
jgi:hypothetical protein